MELYSDLPLDERLNKLCEAYLGELDPEKRTPGEFGAPEIFDAMIEACLGFAKPYTVGWLYKTGHMHKIGEDKFHDVAWNTLTKIFKRERKKPFIRPKEFVGLFHTALCNNLRNASKLANKERSRGRWSLTSFDPSFDTKDRDDDDRDDDDRDDDDRERFWLGDNRLPQDLSRLESNDYLDAPIKEAVQVFGRFSASMLQTCLRYMQHCTYEDMAQMGNIPIGTVRTHIHRYKKTVQEFLPGLGEEIREYPSEVQLNILTTALKEALEQKQGIFARLSAG